MGFDPSARPTRPLRPSGSRPTGAATGCWTPTSGTALGPSTTTPSWPRWPGGSVTGRVLGLLRAWLRAGVLEDGVTTEAGSGTPQGSPISPLLANIALHVLDAEWARTGSSLGMLVRFADDFIVLCTSRARAAQARRRVSEILAGLGCSCIQTRPGSLASRTGMRGSTFSAFT